MVQRRVPSVLSPETGIYISIFLPPRILFGVLFSESDGHGSQNVTDVGCRGFTWEYFSESRMAADPQYLGRRNSSNAVE